MSERKFKPRPPEYVDLAYNPLEPRDSHGRWTSGMPGGGSPSDEVEQIRSLMNQAFAKPQLNTTQKQMQRFVRMHASKGVLSLKDEKGRLKSEHPATLRTFRKVSEEMRMQLYREAGLNLRFPDKSDEELMSMWESPHYTYHERMEFRAEVEARLARLRVVGSAMDQSLTDYVREHNRDAFRRWDKNLKNLPGGKQIIALRERMLTDHTLDHFETIRKHLHEHGKAYAKHIITAVAVASLLHPLGMVAIGGLAAHGVVSQAAPEVFSSLMENIWVHSGLVVALDIPLAKFLDPVFGIFERETRAKKAAKFAEKHQNRKLHLGGQSTTL